MLYQTHSTKAKHPLPQTVSCSLHPCSQRAAEQDLPLQRSCTGRKLSPGQAGSSSSSQPATYTTQ